MTDELFEILLQAEHQAYRAELEYCDLAKFAELFAVAVIRWAADQTTDGTTLTAFSKIVAALQHEKNTLENACKTVI